MERSLSEPHLFRVLYSDALEQSPQVNIPLFPLSSSSTNNSTHPTMGPNSLSTTFNLSKPRQPESYSVNYGGITVADSPITPRKDLNHVS
jgi:hypothetical protein